MADNPVFLMLGNVLAYWYGIFIMLGLAAGIALSFFLRMYQGGKSPNDLLICLIFALPAAFVGSRLYYCWNHTSIGDEKPSFWAFGDGGQSVYGALLGAMLAIIICSLAQRISVGKTLDATVPGTALALAIGRWGAAFSGENVGGIVDSEALHTFPFSVYCETEGVWRSSLFTYQSLIAVVLCAGSVYLFLKKYRDHSFNYISGDLYLLFIIIFFSIQGCFETFRNDPLYFHAPVYELIRLQTVQAGMLMGSVCSAVALSIFILRFGARKGFQGQTFIFLGACAVVCALLYLCYFNIVLRIDMPDPLPLLLHLFGCLGLIGIAGYLFYSQTGIQPDARRSSESSREYRGTPKPKAPRAPRPAPHRAPSKKPSYHDFWD